MARLLLHQFTERLLFPQRAHSAADEDQQSESALPRSLRMHSKPLSSKTSSYDQRPDTDSDVRHSKTNFTELIEHDFELYALLG
jgi:hypothetical protein